MKRSWRAAMTWDAFLIGVPLLIAAGLSAIGWPLGHARALLLAIYTAEIFALLVPPTLYSAVGSRTSDRFTVALEEKRRAALRRTALDPAAIGPALALAIVASTFLFSP
jgi:hypothetical protein